MIIFGDVDPRSPKIGDAKLRDLADFVRERGGGLLMIAGANFSPHAYKDTPLADVLPIEPTADLPPEPATSSRTSYRLELTPVGRLHPIFRLQRRRGGERGRVETAGADVLVRGRLSHQAAAPRCWRSIPKCKARGPQGQED